MYMRRDGGADRLPHNEPQRPAAASQPTYGAGSQVTANRQQNESVIASDDMVEGQIRTNKGVRIFGTVRGKIESSQYVHIEENAQVEADITAEEVVIAGDYEGSVTCRQRLEIRATGRVNGRIETAKLLLHEGGFFEGEMHMQNPASVESGPTMQGRPRPADQRPPIRGQSTNAPSRPQNVDQRPPIRGMSEETRARAYEEQQAQRVRPNQPRADERPTEQAADDREASA
jgi:cytoskeletal protein CcmA (bactofilin family)